MSASSLDKISPVSWTRPVPNSVARPSWLRRPKDAFEPAPPPSSAKPSAAPPSVPQPPPSSRRAAPRLSAPVMREMPSAREVELESEVITLRATIARLEQSVEDARARVLEESEPEIVRLALALAERVVGRELTVDPQLIASWACEGARTLADREHVIIAASADVAPHLGDVTEGEVVIDPLLAAGSCELRAGATTIAVGKEARISALADALGTGES